MTTRTRRRIQRQVLTWYAANQRDLPWRRTRDPYRILISEVMLQQTQVPRVIPKYETFIKYFPTVKDLAAAPPAAVITAWKGLGYNRRALNLRRTAQVVVQEFGAVFPRDYESILALPGVGRYTAGAVLSFAYNVPTPAVDTNVKLFIDHFVPVKTARTENEYYGVATDLIPVDNAREWLHAVMDYASLVLRPQRARRRSPKPAEQFVGSNRYLRGQTLDRLREAPHTLDDLFAKIAAPIDINRDHYEHLVTALKAEGFVEQQGSVVQLRSA